MRTRRWLGQAIAADATERTPAVNLVGSYREYENFYLYATDMTHVGCERTETENQWCNLLWLHTRYTRKS